MADNRCLLSIIVPVYNAEKYVQSCLDSLLQQDIEESQYEIICVNDGSIDKSLSILERYAQNYSQVKLVNRTNGGVSSARNVGLDIAKGEYVWFVDADDWVARNCLGTIINMVEEEQPSAIVLDYRMVPPDQTDQYQNAIFDKNAIKVSIGVPFYVCAVCMAIIKKDLIDQYDIRFLENISYGEDTIFMRDLLDHMRIQDEREGTQHLKVALREPHIYYYRKNEESAVNTKWTSNRLKYLDSLLECARLNRSRAAQEDMPLWYRQQYENLYMDRMVNYLLFWLPGSGLDVDETLRQLIEDGLYPCKKSAWRSLDKAKGMKSKITNIYRVLAFKWPQIYRIYYRQMSRKYLEAKTRTE